MVRLCACCVFGICIYACVCVCVHHYVCGFQIVKTIVTIKMYRAPWKIKEKYNLRKQAHQRTTKTRLYLVCVV